MFKIIRACCVSVVLVQFTVYGMELKQSTNSDLFPLVHESGEQLNAITFLNAQSVIVALKNPTNALDTEHLRSLNLDTNVNRTIAELEGETNQLTMGYGGTIIGLGDDAVRFVSDKYNSNGSLLLSNKDCQKVVYASQYEPRLLVIAAEDTRQVIEEWYFDPREKNMRLVRGAYVSKICGFNQNVANFAVAFSVDSFVMVSSQMPGRLDIYKDNPITACQNLPYYKQPAALTLDLKGQFVSIYSTEGTLELLDLQSQKTVWKCAVGTNNVLPELLDAHLFFSDDGEYLVLQIGSKNISKDSQRLLIMHSKTGKILVDLALPNTGKRAVLSADNLRLLLLVDDSLDGHVLLHSLAKDLFKKMK